MNNTVLKRLSAVPSSIGLVLMGLGSAATGLVNFVWRGFDPAHQPIQAWGASFSHLPVLSNLASALLLAGGAVLVSRRFLRTGATILTAVYATFVLFPLPRLITAPHFLGYHPSVYIGLLVSICQQLLLLVAAAVSYASPNNMSPHRRVWASAARWSFGLCCIDFGLAHLTGVPAVARMVPSWMPLGGTFWAELTGCFFVAAGLSILTAVLDVIAAWLLGFMLLVFSVTGLIPVALAHPHDHVAWGGNAYNLTAVGASWIFARWLGCRSSHSVSSGAFDFMPTHGVPRTENTFLQR